MCNSPIDSLCRSNRLEEAKSFFGEVLEMGIPPDVVTVNILIGALFKAGMSQEANKLLQLMIQRWEA